MITLGIELSSRQGSVALLKDGELLGEKTWLGERVRHNTIFQTLETLIEEAGISYSDISLFAVGRGPGSFSGMRMSFAIAQALALPNRTEVRAVSSGAALALAAARDGAKEICVAGDARRGQFWAGFFNVDATPPSHPDGLDNATGASRLQLSEPWKLLSYEELVVPDGTRLVSPEAERLAEFFAAPDGRCPATAGPLSLRSGPDIGKARFPLASDVARLAQTQSEPLEPLYMHPPVFIEPKYS